MESRELLTDYVTNLDEPVFAIRNLQGMVGAVMARYSRAEGSLRDTLLREFVKEDKLNVKKAHKLIERVLIAYGDDSVGELEGAHLSFENISMLATKVIEHRRIGGSPIEQSTRYIRYDFKDEKTGYHYYTPESIEDEKDKAHFKSLMDGVFDNYSAMWQPLKAYLEQQKPMEEAEYDLGEMGSRYSDMDTPKKQTVFKRTYNNDIKTKVCDILRGFLPLATRANVGLFGNGRFFQHLISKMLSSPLHEANILGEKAFEELSKVIPHYVKRAARSEYVVKNDKTMSELCQSLFSDLKARDTGIALVAPDHEFILSQLGESPTPDVLAVAYQQEQDLNFIVSMVYGYVRASFDDIRQRVKQMSAEDIERLYQAYYGERRTRRDRPERGIEFGYPYNFDMVTEWAVYKDLMRHRMSTIQIQNMSPDLGFEMPEELAAAGLGTLANETVALAESLYQWLEAHYPACAEYAILQGHRVRWMISLNDRALMHMVELRTAPQGHSNYRKASQEMHRLALARFPERAKRMSFVNYDDSYWARSDSEAAQRRKEEKLGIEGD